MKCRIWFTALLLAILVGPVTARAQWSPEANGMWVDIDYLMWWGKGRNVPALVTTSPTGTPRPAAGVLPAAPILFGNGNVGNKLAHGGRITVGTWLEADQTLGVFGRYWGLRGDNTTFVGRGDAAGNPILARPFFDPRAGAENADLVSFPGVGHDGLIDAATTSDVQGADALFRSNVLCGQGYTVDLLGGYHFSRIDDDVMVFTSESDQTGVINPVGTVLTVLDTFDASNTFHGGTLGLQSDFYHGNWSLSVLSKISLGNMRSQVTIAGQQTATPPGGATATTAQGLLARSTNIGTYTRDVTAIVPEFGLTLTYQPDECIRFTGGWNFIYWNDVVLSGDQIDRTVNLAAPAIPPNRPAFQFRDTDYWLHGLTLGVEFYR